VSGIGAIRWAIAMCATWAVMLGAVFGTSSAAAAAPVWLAASPFTMVPAGANMTAGAEQATLEGVACPGAGNCVAVGAYADAGSSAQDQVMVTAQAGGVWGVASKVTLPPDAVTTSASQGAALESVACAAPGDCTAVGHYLDGNGSNDFQAMAATETGGTWGPATKVALPSDATAAASSQKADLSSVACTSVGNCVAVGRYISTASGDQVPMIATETNGAWGQATTITLPPDAFTVAAGQDSVLLSVSCTGAGQCVALGYYLNSNGTSTTGDYAPMVVTETGGVWGQASKLALPADATNYLATFPSVACASQGNCVAVGAYSNTAGGFNFRAATVTETNGVWAPATALALPADETTNAGLQISSLYGVACPGPGDTCVATGDYYSATGGIQAMATSETGGSWNQAGALALPSDAATTASQGARAYSVSCTDSTTCVAVGGYQDASNNTVAMVLKTTPAAATGPATTTPLAISTTSLPSGVVGTAYAAHLSAAGGAGSDTWALSSGSLPAGVKLNASTGVISGTPTATGTASFTVKVSDTGPPPEQASAALSITIGHAAHTTKMKTIGNQRITLVTPPLPACIVKTEKLAVKLTSIELPKSKATKLTFSRVAFYIDKGVKHVHHTTVHTHGGSKQVAVIVYTANGTAHHVPASLGLPLADLKTGVHALRAVISYTRTKKSHGHKRVITVTTAVHSKFRVC
jgi:hypothetical protein